MKLENLQVELSPREYWQAIDLGIQVSRHHIKSLLILSMAMTSILTLLFYTISQSFAITSLLLFWFKPIIERPLLFFISRAIFSEQVSPRNIFLQSKSILSVQWLASFSYRRISFSRSFDDPVLMLEGLTDKQRASRLDILKRENDGAIWLTLFGLGAEILLYFAMALLPLLLLPSWLISWESGFIFNSDYQQLIDIYLTLSYTLAIALVAPFYSVCGFILYLNRRTSLESWHIELGFRKLAKRLTQSSTLAVILLSSLLYFLPITTPLMADEIDTSLVPAIEESIVEEEVSHDEQYPEIQNSQAIQLKEELSRLLESDLFGLYEFEKNYDIDWSFDWDWNFDEEADLNQDLTWLDAIRDLLDYFKALIILLLMLALAWVLMKYRPWQYLSRVSQQGPDMPDVVLGFNVKKENLPSNILDSIAQDIQRGQLREALSLMFRCHLSKAVRINKAPFKQSSTERECMLLMQNYSSIEESCVFEQLTKSWQDLAYAHQALQQDAIDSLFQQWKLHVEEYI